MSITAGTSGLEHAPGTVSTGALPRPETPERARQHQTTNRRPEELECNILASTPQPLAPWRSSAVPENLNTQVNQLLGCPSSAPQRLSSSLPSYEMGLSLQIEELR
mmetsp:Transcript_25334/g.39731  ORF Transcript_25334/g.39731 Transcript_25334/m.39731 type:complete len:106 (-) Transcript_25334:377-694(-)